MKYKYVGDKKITIKGIQYRKGDVVELDGDEKVDWKRFAPVPEGKETKLKVVEKKSKTKKEVDLNGDGMASS